MLPWVDVATGSLGQGLPDGVGVALAGKYLDELPYRVWVLCGDSEMAEDSIWEALDKASYYKLSNLIAMVDVNRLGQRGPTDLSWDVDTYAARAAAFGARVFAIDGHDLAAIDQAVAEAGHLAGHQPSVIVARTRKGRGFSEVEDREDWHGKPLPEHMAERAVVELGGERHLLVRGPRPAKAGKSRPASGGAEVKLPGYERGQKVATRRAYGDALAALGVRRDVVAMDGEVSNSTFADEFAKAYPERYFEMFIAEQQLVAAAVGIAVRGYRRSRPPSPRSSAGPMTSSGWRPSPRPASAWSARTPGSRSAPTARPRWRWRTWPCCARCTARPCCTRPTRPAPPR